MATGGQFLTVSEQLLGRLGQFSWPLTEGPYLQAASPDDTQTSRASASIIISLPSWAILIIGRNYACRCHLHSPSSVFERLAEWYRFAEGDTESVV
jgi:hypothetical protein